jgi:hypothetical protein
MRAWFVSNLSHLDEKKSSALLNGLCRRPTSKYNHYALNLNPAEIDVP